MLLPLLRGNSGQKKEVVLLMLLSSVESERLVWSQPPPPPICFLQRAEGSGVQARVPGCEAEPQTAVSCQMNTETFHPNPTETLLSPGVLRLLSVPLWGGGGCPRCGSSGKASCVSLHSSPSPFSKVTESFTRPGASPTPALFLGLAPRFQSPPSPRFICSFLFSFHCCGGGGCFWKS